MSASSQGVLALNGVSKSFGSSVVLDRVSVRAQPGRILGVVGENGAGKSTLLKIACGLEQPTEGELTFNGDITTLPTYSRANQLGISMVFQEQALIHQLPVYENLFLGLMGHFAKGSVLNRTKMKKSAEDILQRLGIHEDMDLSRPIGEYSFGQRQVIEIARAFAVADIVGSEYPIILLDEATASLDKDERKVLFRIMNSVRDRAAIIFVSHILAEILDLCDDLLILKDGKVVEEGPASDYTERQLHSLITGREVPESMYEEHRQCGSTGQVLLHAADLSVTSEFSDVDLEIRSGEILGIAGVVGSGKESLGLAIAGLAKRTSGEIQHFFPSRPGYVPRERLAEGVIIGDTVSKTITITPLVRGAFRKGQVVNTRAAREWAAGVVEKIGIRPNDPDANIENLSGGNQQKAIMGRWLKETPELLVLNNPTRGVDVGSKSAIYKLIRSLSESGIGILLISDDLSELIGMSDRILAMKEHRVVAEVPAAAACKPTEAELVALLV